MNKHTEYLIPVVLLLALTGMGCGSQSAASRQQSLLSSDPSVTTGNGGSTPVGNNTTSTTPPRQTGVSPLNFTIEGLGYTSVTKTVRTRNILKVTFRPGQQNRTIPNTGVNIPYSVLGVFISVGGILTPTPALTNGYNGTAAETSSVIDLSDNFTKNCAETDTTCRQTVSITITKPNGDDACQYNWWAFRYWYCPTPYPHVMDEHPWNGTLRVETDDTNSL